MFDPSVPTACADLARCIGLNEQQLEVILFQMLANDPSMLDRFNSFCAHRVDTPTSEVLYRSIPESMLFTVYHPRGRSFRMYVHRDEMVGVVWTDLTALKAVSTRGARMDTSHALQVSVSAGRAPRLFWLAHLYPFFALWREGYQWLAWFSQVQAWVVQMVKAGHPMQGKHVEWPNAGIPPVSAESLLTSPPPPRRAAMLLAAMPQPPQAALGPPQSPQAALGPLGPPQAALGPLGPLGPPQAALGPLGPPQGWGAPEVDPRLRWPKEARNAPPPPDDTKK